MRACGWLFYERRDWTNVSLRTNILLPQEIYISGWQLSPLAGLVCGGEHDPEKWIPVFRKDHAQTKR
jgi:hypothetical protein